MRATVDIRQITAIDKSLLESLNVVLEACVTSGASVGFMNPFDADVGRLFWTDIGKQVTRGDRLLLIAQTTGGVVGTVQVVLAQPRNQPHRGEISKLLVLPTMREHGVGQALMLAAERYAAALGKSLLVLDTASDAARRLYARLGWTHCGDIPNYALLPDGAPCATSIYFKQIGAAKSSGEH